MFTLVPFAATSTNQQGRDNTMKLLFILFVYAFYLGLALVGVGAFAYHNGYPVLASVTFYIVMLIIFIRWLAKDIKFQ